MMNAAFNVNLFLLGEESVRFGIRSTCIGIYQSGSYSATPSPWAQHGGVGAE